jgi:hypothetical protein
VNHHGKDRWCSQGSHMAPTDSFRVVPGTKNKRECCEVCYQRLMSERARIKRERAIG